MKQIMTKDDEAVSPIIATILLIAITVVLAATLVTILGGFTHGASGSAATASVTTQFNSTSNGATTPEYTTSIYLNVSSFSVSGVSSSKIDITLTVTNSTGTNHGTYTYTGNLGGPSLTSTDQYAVATITITADPSSFTGGSSYVISITPAAGQETPSQTTSVTAQLSYSGSVIYSSSTVT